MDEPQHSSPDDASSKAIVTFRKALEDMRIQSTNSYDKVLITVSGGALVASLSIVPNFSQGQPVCKTTLVLAWITLTLTILCVGLSFFSSKQAARKAIAELDRRTDWFQPTDCWSDAIPWLNAIGGLSFVAGIILMIIFASANFLAR